jgi:hypothetical protein
LLSFRGISTPSLQAQGEQRRSSYFNNDRDIASRTHSEDQKKLSSPVRSIPFQHIERRLHSPKERHARLNGDAAAHVTVGLFAILELDFQPLRLHLL